METKVLTNPGANDEDMFTEFVLLIRWGYGSTILYLYVALSHLVT